MVELRAELQTFWNRLPNMVSRHNGQYVVIKGAKVEHFDPTYEGALSWAYDKFGLEQFFVKKVSEEEAVAHFSRDVGPCRP
ncbi:hypothetical protein VVAX_01208 [Variovorax paradoxus]|jgi:hypothetical protein|uniref:DUF5678 domain-containing protein n=1 Tax=Variovorax paradoxus TaxID=34073 RepID=A0A679IYE1_VARPD|nr:hypothetical protein VVAX_01208 [Variovorax paradoxus]